MAASMGPVLARQAGGDEVDWSPVDRETGAVVECTLGSVGSGGVPHLYVFHVVNPCAGSWGALVPVMRQFYRQAQGKELELVAFDDWVTALKSLSLATEESQMKPRVKMIPQP